MIEVVHIDRDNPNTIIVYQDGVVIDFSAATRMVLSLVGSSVVADTNIDSSLINWSLGDGRIKFNLNGLGVSSNTEHFGTLVVYDPAHSNGQVVFSGAGIGVIRIEEPDETLRLQFVEG
jgi:hypothetical protein